MDFQRLAVIGPGLLGGSLVKAARRRSPDLEIRAWGRREEAVARLRLDGEASLASTDLGEVTRGADLIILATPIGVMESNIDEMIRHGTLGEGMVVTDVGSVKAPVVRALESKVARSGARFVGSHPMAGSEKTGLEHAAADLFEDAACLLTPTGATDPCALERVETFWKWLGARTTRLTPEAHDRAVALISHLPHLLAALLVESVLGSTPEAGAFAGGGFRDSTRIASGAPDMWTEILLENRGAVREALAQFLSLAGESLAFLDDLKKEDLHRLLADAKARRDSLL